MEEMCGQNLCWTLNFDKLLNRIGILTPTFVEGVRIIPKFMPILIAMCIWTPILLETLLLLLLLLALLIWFDIVQIFSLGLSLPTETGLGLSEQGDASRDTDSESSSLSGFPVKYLNLILI